MIAEIGHFALVLALGMAVLQIILPAVGAYTGDDRLMHLGRSVSVLQFTLIAAAFAAVTNAFVTSDFSLAVVAQNSHSLKPMLYKVAGVWGNHEGSMLLWVLILALCGAAIAGFGTNLPDTFRSRVLSVQGAIGAAFLLFILLTSNPFTRIVPPPLDGSDLNPLLQDPGLAFHPPFLYLGYVGFSVAFSFAIAALMEGKVGPAWARWVRPWTLAAWCALTVGIALGSWWAYYELGWGGWWFWDPVENASLLPWLSGTALLHSAIVVEKRGALKTWTILLAILTFSLSLSGTFLVRSGILTSVHSFATDPTRGVFILAILAATVGGALTLFLFRAPAMEESGQYRAISREGAILLNNIILAAATATVFVGTFYPLFLELATGDKISVGAPYFNLTFGALMAPLLLFLPFGALMAWRKGNLAGVSERLWMAGLAALTVALLTYIRVDQATVASALGIGLAAWVIGGTLTDLAERTKLFQAPLAVSWARTLNLPRAVMGMALAHLGMGVLLAAMVAMSAWKQEVITTMSPGDEVAIGGYQVRFGGVTQQQGPNYVTERGTFALSRNGDAIATLYPEKRFYPVQQQTTTEAAIRTSGARDIYVVIGDLQPDGSQTVRLYHNPLAPWLWGGAILMALGGLTSLSDRRYRVGVPARKPAHTVPAMASLGVLLLVAIAALAIAPNARAVQPDEILQDPALEMRAREIGAEVRCLVCQNQSIDDSNAELARDLRILVRERLVAGDTDRQVKAYLVSRYGDFVLLRPPVKATTFALWATPAIALALGLLSAGLYVRKRQSGASGPGGLTEAEQADFDQLMAERKL